MQSAEIKGYFFPSVFYFNITEVAFLLNKPEIEIWYQNKTIVLLKEVAKKEFWSPLNWT